MLPESIYPPPQKPPQKPQRLKKSESSLSLSKRPSTSSAAPKVKESNPPEGQKNCRANTPHRARSSPSLSKPTPSVPPTGGNEKGKVAAPPPQSTPKSTEQAHTTPKFNFKKYVEQMSAPREAASTSNFQLSLSLGENREVAPHPPTPISSPRRPEVRPLPPSSTLRYETKLFEIEVMDRGLRWKRCTKKYPKLHLKDEVFNYMCRPFLDSHLIALELLGCTEENRVLKLLTEGLSENSREVGNEIFNFEYRPNSPNKYRPFGNSIGTIRPYTPASKEEEEGDPRYLPCKHCTKPNRMMNSPAPRPDPIKFQFPVEFENSIEIAETNPSDPISGPVSVSYTTRSGRSTRRLSLSPDQAPPTASTSGASMPPPNCLVREPGPPQRSRQPLPLAPRDQDR